MVAPPRVGPRNSTVKIMERSSWKIRAVGAAELRPTTGTGEEDLLKEELQCSSSVASLVNELWCRIAI
jgi:hypothetical protein